MATTQVNAASSASSRRLNTARDIGEWVRGEMAGARPDAAHATRVITQEIDRWFKSGLTDDEILAVAKEPPDTGTAQWDALIEGVVAYRLHGQALTSPLWTRRTRLDVGWSPYEEVVRDTRWHLLDVFTTPAEILDKGVTLPRSDLVRL